MFFASPTALCSRPFLLDNQIIIIIKGSKDNNIFSQKPKRKRKNGEDKKGGKEEEEKKKAYIQAEPIWQCKCIFLLEDEIETELYNWFCTFSWHTTTKRSEKLNKF